MVLLSHFVLVKLEVFFVLDKKFFSLLNFFVELAHHGFKIIEGVNLGFKLFSYKIQFIL